MSEQGEKIVRQVLKTDPRALDFRQSLNYLIQHFNGSMRAAGRAIGVSDGTIRRWKAGTVPKAINRNMVESRARQERMRPSRLGDSGVLISVVSKDRKRGRRERDINGQQLALKPGTVAAMADVWQRTGDADAAARVFLAGIQEPWYRRELSAGFRRSVAADRGEKAGGPAGGGMGGAAGPTGGGGDIDEEQEDSDLAYEGLESDYGMSVS